MADGFSLVTLKYRWQQFQPRERRTLIWGAVVLGLVLAFGLIWSPLSSQRQQLAAQVQARSATLTVVQQAAEQMEQLPGSSVNQLDADDADHATSLLTQVDQTARMAGLAASIRRIEPVEDGVVRMQLEGATFDQLIAWLEQLSVQRGIQLTEARLSKSDSPGQVDGRLQLSH